MTRSITSSEEQLLVLSCSSGNAARSPRKNGPMRRNSASSTSAMLRLPVTSPLISFALLSSALNTASTFSAFGSSTSPDSVSSMRPGVLRNRAIPSSCSMVLMWAVTAGWVTCSTSEARVRCPSRATVTNERILRISTRAPSADSASLDRFPQVHRAWPASPRLRETRPDTGPCLGTAARRLRAQAFMNLIWLMSTPRSTSPPTGMASVPVRCGRSHTTVSSAISTL